MKRDFGNMFTRLMWGGVRLLPIEQAVLEKLVQALPTAIRDAVIVQLDACNLVQREIDGRALNFYRKTGGRVTREGVPDLPIKQGDVLLLRAAFAINNGAKRFRATMTAIDRQFFCINFDQDVRPFGPCRNAMMFDVTDSWRSAAV